MTSSLVDIVSYQGIIIQNDLTKEHESFISKLSSHIRNEVEFFGRIKNLTTRKECPLKVEFVHVAEYSQFFLIEENPRILLRIYNFEQESFHKNDILHLELSLKVKNSSINHRFFSHLFKGFSGFGKDLWFNDQEGNDILEKSFGANRDLVVFLTKSEVSNQHWKIKQLQHHTSLFDLCSSAI